MSKVEQNIKKRNLKNSYQLSKDNDGRVTVTIKPLMEDILIHLDFLKQIDTKNFDHFDMSELNDKIKALHSFYTFLGALLTEYRLNEMQDASQQSN